MNKPAATASPFRNAQQRENDRAAKREAVLLAAVRMFNQRGFHATSLDDVAASLGISKPLIYHYLGAKDQVLFECMRIGLEQLRAAAEEGAGLPGTGMDRLKRFLRRYAECIMEDFSRCVIRTGDEVLSPDIRPSFRALKSEIDQSMRKLIADAAADGSAKVSDVKLTAFAFAGALSWTARWHEPGGPLEPAEIAEQLVEVLTRGIMP
ncbi:MAG TPA: TetR/AcrR family transcriptional regulator [Acidocella sp.]|jgi:AcrR family transcriptional regulator|nr:TetR/AcrR family transcriptional regulator [Acidocella sp.]